MRPTIPRFVSILSRSEVPEKIQARIIPRPPLPSEQPVAPTLVDHLIARREQRLQKYLAAQRKAEETGALKVEAQPWPENLRIEPIVKRDAFAKVTNEARMQLKEALKER